MERRRLTDSGDGVILNDKSATCQEQLTFLRQGQIERPKGIGPGYLAAVIAIAGIALAAYQPDVDPHKEPTMQVNTESTPTTIMVGDSDMNIRRSESVRGKAFPLTPTPTSTAISIPYR